MIHKLNNKGMTAIEILVTFVLIAIIVVSMYDGVVDLKTRETVSSYKLSLNTYKNLLTKDIQDDLIKTGLSGVSTGALDGNTGYRVTFTFRDGSQKYLEVKQVFGCNAIDLTEAQEVCTQRGIALDQSDDFSISYGPEDDMTEYKLPDLGHEDIQNYTEGDTGTHRIYALRINEVSISTANRVFSLRITFTHPDLGNRYSIDIVSPINMDIAMSIDGGESTPGGGSGGEEEPSTSMMKGRDWWTSEYDRNSVTSIVTKSDLSVPSTAVYSWDASVAGDGSVMAYLEDDGSGNGTYRVTIGGNGKIIANTDSSNLFTSFSSVQTFDLQYLDTSQVTNMSEMFSFCSGVTNLDLSTFDTSQVTDMTRMFSYSTSLITLNVSSFNTSKVTSLREIFGECENLVSVDVSGFDTSNVTNMSCMFMHCWKLTSIDVSGFDTSNVTDMGNMFQNCRRITSLDVSGFDTSNVTDMGAMFMRCEDLTSIDVSGFDTSNVTDMEAMFRDCYGLVNLDLSSFDTSNVTNMYYMFYSCDSLVKLNLSGFNTSKLEDVTNMFNSCSSLTDLDMRNATFDNVSDYTDMFSMINHSVHIVVKDEKAKKFIEDRLGDNYITGATVTISS